MGPGPLRRQGVPGGEAPGSGSPTPRLGRPGRPRRGPLPLRLFCLGRRGFAIQREAGRGERRGGCEIEVPHEPMKEAMGPVVTSSLRSLENTRGVFVDVTSTKLNGLYGDVGSLTL